MIPGKRDSQEERHDVLSRILPQYKRISEAPREVLNAEHERGQLYKSIDNFGNVYLIVNPAVWDFNGKSFYRPAPFYKYNWEEAKQAAKLGV